MPAILIKTFWNNLVLTFVVEVHGGVERGHAELAVLLAHVRDVLRCENVEAVGASRHLNYLLLAVVGLRDVVVDAAAKVLGVRNLHYNWFSVGFKLLVYKRCSAF